MPETTASNQRLHARVHGRVQGVFYRATACRRARELGLVGWVRNCADGSVELVAEGAREPLRELVDFCHQGPRAARVAGVDCQWGLPTGEFDGFEIRY